jgi:hypothetical protein
MLVRNRKYSFERSRARSEISSGGGAPPTVCHLVVNDLSLPVFGLVETIENLLASPPSCSLEDLEAYWDTLSQLHLPRNLQVDLYSWHKLALASNSSELERAGELVRKVFTSSRCYLH